MQPRVIRIPQAALMAKPDSLLSSVVRETWKTSQASGEGNNGKGLSAENPIPTEPLRVESSQEMWTHLLADMFREAYLWFLHHRIHDGGNEQDATSEKHTKIQLPVDRVELVDALMVIHYYGVQPDDVSSQISYQGVANTVIFRAKLFLKENADMQKAVKYVNEYLHSHPPHLTTYFIFADRDTNMDYVNQQDHAGLKRRREYVSVGGDGTDCEDHFEWSQGRFFQEILLPELENELGMEARFLDGYDAFLHDDYYR